MTSGIKDKSRIGEGMKKEGRRGRGKRGGRFRRDRRRKGVRVIDT